MADSWWTRRWSCVDSPLVSDEFVDEMRLRYGEESNAFRIRVLGEFPLADDDTIIPFHLAESALHRDVQVSEGQALCGAWTWQGLVRIARRCARAGSQL